MANNPIITALGREPILLLTRPQDSSARFAKDVTDTLGPMRVVISPLMKIRFLPLDGAFCHGRVPIFTSMNGVAAWQRAQLDAQRPCFCVGQATGDAARALGFSATVAGGTVEHLLADILSSAPEEPLVHIRGVHTRGNLVDRLQQADLVADSVLAYEQHLVPLTKQARSVLTEKMAGMQTGGANVIVPLFSPRTAAQFAKQCPADSTPHIIAISSAAAEPLGEVVVADQPNAASMVAAIGAWLKDATAT